jgi:amino acid adenylation domain-containing protein
LPRRVLQEMSKDTLHSGNATAQSTAGLEEGEFLFPVTFAQRRLWFLDRLQPGSSSYLIPWSIRIKGPLDPGALREALNEIVRRHEILRTTFPAQGDEPLQAVAQELEIPLPITDISNAADPEEEARGLAAEEAQRPVDLERGPLLRAQLLRLGEGHHVLLQTMHHIVFDGGSRRVFISELSDLYEAFREGKPSPFAAPKLQYGDYAVWQREHLSKKIDEQCAYWKRQLSGAPAALALPTDKPRPAVQSFRGAAARFAFSNSLKHRLAEIARRNGASLFMILLAGFQALLARYSGQDDIVVGTPVAGRNRVEIENLIGFFANTLALRTRLGGDPSFTELLERVKEGALAAFAHQDAPFERLVEELQPERSLSYNPIFQVMFSLQNKGNTGFRLGSLDVEALWAGGVSAKFDLTIHLAENAEGLLGLCEYSTDLFEETTIARFLEHYRTLLEAVAEDPSLRLSRLPLLTANERTQILGEWNATVADYPRQNCLHHLFEEQAARSPAAVACVYDGQELSYRALNEAANRLAHELKARGIGPGERVAIFTGRSLEMMVGLLGIQKSGAAYVPVDPAYPPERAQMILEEAKPRIVVTTSGLLEILPQHGAETICLDRDAARLAGQPSANPESAVTPEDLVYIIFTSGSTGRPKGVQIPHRAVVNLLTAMARELQMGPGDVFPALASFAFDMCIPELYLALSTGGTVAIAPRHMAGDGEALAAFLKDHRATVVHATPTTWNLLLEAGFSGSGLKRCIGAEALPQDLCRRLLKEDASLYNFYGPTETTVWSAMHHFTSENEPVVLGKPLANQRFYILDKALEPVPAGVWGEIYIGGDGVALGYLNQPQMTAERFLYDPFAGAGRMYKTGDLGRYLADGRIEFGGRSDHQVKVRGYRIELGEIEAALGSHPAVQECVAVAREDVPGDTRLVGYVVPAAGCAADATELRAWVGKRLPDYMIPAAIVNLTAFPLTPNGKVDRKNLPAPEYRRLDSQESYVAPRTPAEEVIAGIWAEVLKLDQVGAGDNFFILGGHSLLGAQMIARVRQALRVDLPLRALFESPTVAGLAARAGAMRKGSEREEAPLTRVERTGPLPQSFAQQRLWILDQIESQGATYNVPSVLRLRGPLRIGVLQRCVDELSRRHEVLRTRFEAVDGHPAQIVEAAATPAVELIDLTGLPSGERELEARRLAMEEAQRPFDLRKLPLWRVRVWRIGADDHVASINAHHIIVDAWSLGVLWRELCALYTAFAAEKPSPLPELRLQYADYASWQRRYLAGRRMEEQTAYWKNQLAGAPQALNLPTDRQRPPLATYAGANLSVTLPAPLLERLRALSRKEGATLYMTLLGAFSVLLSVYSGQEDLCIGSPIAGRNRAELEKLLGVFINTLVLRTDVSGDPSFRELLARIREITLDAYAHQDVPFEHLVEELRPQRDRSRNPLFQTMLILQNTPEGGWELPDIAISRFTVRNENSKFDLTLIASERPDGLQTTWQFNTDLFDRATIERMMGHFRNLLEGIAEAPAAKVSELPLLGEGELAKFAEWNATTAEFPTNQCLHRLVEEEAAHTPDAPAVVFGSVRLSYRELNERANQIARYLKRCGAGPGVLVGISVERSAEMVASLLGILKSGAAYVPVDPAYPAERRKFILEDSQAAVLLTETPLAGLAEFGGRTVCVDAEWPRIAQESKENLAETQPSDTNAYVLYTSGSTGKPKGVEVTHRGLVNFLTSMRREPGLKASDSVLAVTTLSFDIAGLELYLPLISGAKVVVASRAEATDGRQLIALMERCQVTMVQVTPATWRLLLDAGWAGSPNLKGLCGGEALSAGLASRLIPRCGELWNVYGPTETTIWSSVYMTKSAVAGNNPIGKPIANTTMYVLDARRKRVPVGVPGELYIGGEGVARGYLRRPALTAERFIESPFVKGERLYRTGDVVKFLPDGNLQYIERADFQVKVRGHRIELGEIEAVLQRRGVRECVAVVREDTPGDQRLVAYVGADSKQTADPAELRAWVSQHLPDYMVPAAIVVLERLPLTPNGKVDRKNLPAPEYAREAAGSYLAPRTLLEEKLAAVWAKVLGVASVGVRDNFFELGGHSLLAVRLFSEMEAAVGKPLQLNMLFSAPTIEEIASRIQRDAGDSAPVPVKSSLHAARAEGSKPALFAAHGIGGTVLTFRELASYLPADQPFYCLEGLDVDGSWTSLEELCAHYVRDIRAFQPEGPYYLTGSSFGGMVVFEIAQQLYAQGQEVAFLGLLDTSNMGRLNLHTRRQRMSRSAVFFRERIAHHLSGLLTRKLSDWPRYFGGRVIAVGRRVYGRLWRVMYKSYRTAPNRIPSVLQNLKRVFNAAGMEYIPKVYPGKLTLFRAEVHSKSKLYDPKKGWSGLSLGGIEIIDVPGDHNSMLKSDPHVRVLARELAAALRRVTEGLATEPAGDTAQEHLAPGVGSL